MDSANRPPAIVDKKELRRQSNMQSADTRLSAA
jgi:hypothetical protein